MILDLIVILLIVILSYVLSFNSKNKECNCIGKNIIVGFSGIIFYKLARYFKLKDNLNTNNLPFLSNKEKFTVDTSISDFITGGTNQVINENTRTLNDEKLAEYTTKISELTAEIKKLNNNAKQSNIPSAPEDIQDISSISLENQQAYQQFQIDFLSKQVKNAQDMINADAMAKSTIKYKPIKLYSSCVANADGSLSKDNPIKDEFQGIPDKSIANSYATKQLMNTISQTNSDNTPIRNDTNNLLQTLLSKLAK